MWPDGKMRLDTNGWQTVTSKDRLNEWLPAGYNIYQENRVWYFVDARVSRVEASRYLYQDGMSISPGGLVEGAELYNPAVIKKVNLLKKQIKQYAKDYTQALTDGKVPAPSGGDCWYCLMFDPVSPSTEHLVSHMSEDERYYVPSILKRAMNEFPTSIALQWYVGHY